MNITLKWDGDSGDRKRAFVVAEENDGWKDLRIEVDTDDCDREHAKAAMQEVIDRVNASQVRERRLREALAACHVALLDISPNAAISQANALEVIDAALSSPVAEQKHPDSERLDWLETQKVPWATHEGLIPVGAMRGIEFDWFAEESFREGIDRAIAAARKATP